MSDHSLQQLLHGSGAISQYDALERQRLGAIRQLVETRQLPAHGWPNTRIQALLYELAACDSNSAGGVGAGEREGRVYSDIVRQRHFGMAHGIGRSGDLAAQQPKALGSSIILKLTHSMLLHTIKIAGITKAKGVVLVPAATGMCLTLALMTLKAQHPNPNAQYVLWSRIDQKTCLKSIIAANLTPIVIQLKSSEVNDELVTDVDVFRTKICELGADQIVAIVSTSSGFAPRAPDALVKLSNLAKDYGVAHLVNNAYGLQAISICKLISNSAQNGRIDAVVHSTDKNLLVPVGGSFVVDFNGKLTTALRQMYPGRASMAPVLDVFITLLSMGQDGWMQLLQQREIVYAALKEQLTKIASKYGERLLDIRSNPISLAITLDRLCPDGNASYIGSMLYIRNVSGLRAISREKNPVTIGTCTFSRYGAHADHYPHQYLTAAAAIGMTLDDVKRFAKKLDAVFAEVSAKQMILRNELH